MQLLPSTTPDTQLGSAGVPVKLMHEAEGHVVTIELKTGEMYRGELFEAEDNWNMQVGIATVADMMIA